MSEWQPIETAPSDGQRILLFDPSADRPFVGYMFRFAFNIGQWDDHWVASSGEAVHPTHWMSLPDPPK